MPNNVSPNGAAANGLKQSSIASAAKGKRGGNKKISRNLVGLSAAAILAVYGVGYAQTQSAATQYASQASPVVATLSNLPAQTASSGIATVAAASQYKDGTYAGSGYSRHGGVQAQVTVQSGKIVSAAIIQTSTRYPASAIASLPSAVVAQQSTNVQLVSGATDSSDAYLQAISSALQQALA
jgi:uncharacterized protein with FMN-binding domain